MVMENDVSFEYVKHWKARGIDAGLDKVLAALNSTDPVSATSLVCQESPAVYVRCSRMICWLQTMHSRTGTLVNCRKH